MNGPIPCSSVRGRPLTNKLIARSGQRNALRAALRKARTRMPELISASRASNSARSAFETSFLKTDQTSRAASSFVLKGRVAMTWENFARLSKSDRNHLYRCSGCGKLVDDRNAGEVKIHRDHVRIAQPARLPRQQQTGPILPSRG